jgi:CubicO group peptidase (beta-lactamase class C family)
MAQPGERWMYHVSCDVMGMLIARVSGKSLGAFMRERIFEPLGMKDTAFHVGADRLERFPTAYLFNHQTRALEVYDGVTDSAWRSPPPFESAGGGLVSTVDDYFAFARMMLNKGRHGREQILSRASVELMTSDQLTPQQREGAELFFGGHTSWGYGMSVDTKRDDLCHVPGRFGWSGGLGTSAYTDPTNGVIGILLTQRLMDSPTPPPVFSDFWTLAYAAVE